MAYLCEGKPLLAIVEAHSELARLIVENGIGIVVATNDAATLADALRRLLMERSELAAMAANALRVGRDRFSPERVLPAWPALFAELFSEERQIACR